MPNWYNRLMTVNENIRLAALQRLKVLNWTQGDLAKLAGVKQPTVSRLLAGTQVGRPETWQQLLDALGLELTVREKGDRA